MKLADPTLDRIATARSLLLEPYGLDEGKLARALGTIFEHRADYADLYFQYTKSESFALEEGIVKSGSFGIEQGVGVRAVIGDKTAFSYSDDISLEALMEASRSVRSIARAGGGKVKVASRIAHRPQPVLYSQEDPLGSLDAAAKVKLLERREQM
ncbi:MAG: DNA gyrase modulator, partial [Burkholderiaceae bacterium]